MFAVASGHCQPVHSRWRAANQSLARQVSGQQGETAAAGPRTVPPSRRAIAPLRRDGGPLGTSATVSPAPPIGIGSHHRRCGSWVPSVCHGRGGFDLGHAPWTEDRTGAGVARKPGQRPAHGGAPGSVVAGAFRSEQLLESSPRPVPAPDLPGAHRTGAGLRSRLACHSRRWQARSDNIHRVVFGLR